MLTNSTKYKRHLKLRKQLNKKKMRGMKTEQCFASNMLIAHSLLRGQWHKYFSPYKILNCI